MRRKGDERALMSTAIGVQSVSATYHVRLIESRLNVFSRATLSALPELDLSTFCCTVSFVLILRSECLSGLRLAKAALRFRGRRYCMPAQRHVVIWRLRRRHSLDLESLRQC